jgi:hypothetical protein
MQKRPLEPKKDVRTLNANLDTVQDKVYEARWILIEVNKFVTLEFIHNVLLDREESPL